MKLYVGRHGYAGVPSRDPKKERERPLKPEGVQMVKATARSILNLGDIPACIFCSPFQRTIQTADIYGKILGIQVEVIGDMSPVRPLTTTLTELLQGKFVTLKRVMMIGHRDNLEPLFRGLAGSDSAFDDIAMGEVRRLKIDRWDLDWKEKWRMRPSDFGLPNYYS